MTPTAAVRDDRIGKPFLVIDRETRGCLICEQLFSRLEAPKHAQVVCLPQNESFPNGGENADWRPTSNDYLQAQSSYARKTTPLHGAVVLD